MLQNPPGIVVVTRPTRMQGLLSRWATRGQAAFVFKRNRMVEFTRRKPSTETSDLRLQQAQINEIEQEADEDFLELESEDATYQVVVDQLRADLALGLPIQFIDREYLPTFNFGNTSVVVVVGQDGLVANTAKYVGSIPIVAVNPDPARIDGVLLPFTVSEARSIVMRTLKGAVSTRSVTLAQAALQDGQKLLAFNDLFIGARSHVSARYELTTPSGRETHSSSGLIVSTGAGSSGWLSSLVNMAKGFSAFFNQTSAPQWSLPMDWESRQLVWAVREPFLSKTSQANLVAGCLTEGETLLIESQMAEGGVSFSDGVEKDFLQFSSGTLATISVAEHCAELVAR